MMKYFQIFVDEHYTPPTPINWYGKLDRKSRKGKKAYEMSKHTLLMLEDHMQMVFTDIITFPCFMVSEKVKRVLQQYEPGILYARVIFFSQKRKVSKTYYIPFLSEVRMASGKNSGLGCIAIEEEALTERVIVEVRGLNKSNIVVRLDVLESILRRNAVGVGVKEVEVVK